MSENQYKEDDIFKKRLSFWEILKKSREVFLFYKNQIFLSYFIIFIPVLVFAAIFFRIGLAHETEIFSLMESLKNATQVEVISAFQKLSKQSWFFNWFSVRFIFPLILQVYFSALVLYGVSYFEKRIISPVIFIKKIFLNILPFLTTLFIVKMLTLFGFIAFFIPGIICLVLFSFSLLLVFSERLFGVQALRESVRTVKNSLIYVFLYLIIINIFEIFIHSGSYRLVRLIKWPRIELEFFINYVLVYLLTIVPAIVVAVFFYNIRNLVKPKSKNFVPDIEENL